MPTPDTYRRARIPKALLVTDVDWEALARDVLKRQKNYGVSNADLEEATGVRRAFVKDAQNARPVPAREMLLLARWVGAHPYRYLRAPKPGKPPKVTLAPRKRRREAADEAAPPKAEIGSGPRRPAVAADAGHEERLAARRRPG